MRVLIIEDDPAVASSLSDALKGYSFDSEIAPTGQAGLEFARKGGFDLVTLDLGLPDFDGQDLCRKLREITEIPIIVISARDQEVDRVLALEFGADDYLVKPYGISELVARIRAVFRRSRLLIDASPADGSVKVGPLAMNERERTASLNGQPIHLTQTEFDLLFFLARDPGRVMNRNEILRDVWGGEWFGSTKTLDAHVASLRKKLERPDWIVSIRGVGFKLVDPT